MRTRRVVKPIKRAGFRCSRISLEELTGNMFSLFVGLLGMWACLVGTCQAGNLPHSGIAPLSIVYTLYPYYEADSLLEIFKTEEPLQIANNVDSYGRRVEDQEARNAPDGGARDGTSGSNDRQTTRDQSEEKSPVENRNEGTAEITYWPPVQRGAAPKPRLSRADALRSSNLKSHV